MIELIKKFRKEEEGAITVDWIVLTAAIAGLGIAVISTFQNNADTLTTTI